MSAELDALNIISQTIQEVVGTINLIIKTVGAIVLTLEGGSNTTLSNINDRIGQMWTDLQQEVRDTQTMVIRVQTVLTQQVASSTNEIIGRIDNSSADLYRQAQGNTLDILNKIGEVETQLKGFSTNLTAALKDAVAGLTKTISDDIESLKSKIDGLLDSIKEAIAKELSTVTAAIDAFHNDTNDKLDKIRNDIAATAVFIANQSMKNTDAINAKIDTLATNLHQDTLDLSKNVREGLDAITTAIGASIVTMVAGIGVALEAAAVTEATPAAAQATSLAAIAASLAEILPVFAFLGSLDFGPLLENPEGFLGEVVANLTKMYFDVARKAYEEFPSPEEP